MGHREESWDKQLALKTENLRNKERKESSKQLFISDAIKGEQETQKKKRYAWLSKTVLPTNNLVKMTVHLTKRRHFRGTLTLVQLLLPVPGSLFFPQNLERYHSQYK